MQPTKEPDSPSQKTKNSTVSIGSGRGWMRFFPGLSVLSHYKLNWLYHDVYAGLVLTTMLVPVGIAYAVASGLPGIYGLYATAIPLLVYALFGPSRILVLGPDSSLTAIVLAVIISTAQGDPARAISIASMMAVVAGLICLVAGFAKLGFVTELLSKPIRYGYMNGIALTVMMSQLPKLFGLKASDDGPLNGLIAAIHGLEFDQINWMTLGIGLLTLVLIIIFRQFQKFPAFLFAVAIAAALVFFFDLTAKQQVVVLGPIPNQLPEFVFPWIEQSDILPVLIGGIGIALVTFADTSVLSRSMAMRYGDHVDQNQEMIALGAANLAAGFFQGFAVSSSSSRTPVAYIAGAKTQVTGLIGALGVIAILLWMPNALQFIPESALAAVVMTAAWNLFEFGDLKRIFRIQKWEFWLSIFCTISVVTLGVIPGIMLAVTVAIIEFLWEGWRPHFAILGRVDGVKGYHDINRYPEAKQVPGLLLFRWDAPLFFANVELFQRRVLDAIGQADSPIQWVVIAAEPITNFDVTASDFMMDLFDILKQSNIKLVFSEMKDPVKDLLKQFEIFELIGEEAFYPTIGAAVKAYIDTHQVEWEDWQDRA